MIWASILFVVIAVLALIVRKMLKNDNETYGGATVVAVLAFLVAVGAFFLATTSIVPQKHYGIQTTFGKATGKTVGAGLQWHGPFSKFEAWDATRQSFNTLGTQCKEPGNGDLWVTIAGQGNACVRVQVEWESAGEVKASENWAAYKPVDGKDRFDVFYDRRVAPSIKDAVQATFRPFNPMTSVDKTTGEAVAPNLDAYKATLTSAINERIGADIKVLSVSFGTMGYDGPTSQSIAAYGQKVRESRNLKIDETNAETRRRIAGDSGLTPFQSACLAQIRDSGKGEPGFCEGASGKVTVTRANTPSE